MCINIQCVYKNISSIQFSWSCRTCCDTMDCIYLRPKKTFYKHKYLLTFVHIDQSTRLTCVVHKAYFPVHHLLLELTYSNSCPSSQWCHPTISSFVVPFSSCLQSFPASGSFPMSQFFAPGGQSIGVSASASVLPVNTQDWSPLGLTGLISNYI